MKTGLVRYLDPTELVLSFLSGLWVMALILFWFANVLLKFLNWEQCYDAENGEFPGKTSNSPFFLQSFFRYNFFVSKSREISRFRCLNIPPCACF